MKRLYLAALWALPISIMLFGCATAPREIVRTVEVQVPVTVPCAQALPPEPSWFDTADKLRAAPNHDERVRLLLLGRMQRIQRITDLAASLAGCLPAD
jgi:hypothetical protein